MMRARWTRLLVVLAAGLSSALATDPPSSALNPVSGFIEVVDTTLSGQHWHVRHVANPGNGHLREVTVLTAGNGDDAAPQIAISPAGGTWVTWWTAGPVDQVYYRRRTSPDGAWSTAALIGDAQTSARKPAIAFDGATPWFAWEIGASPSRSIVAAQGGANDPEPMPSWTVLAQTGSNAELNLMLHAEAGHLWVTWEDGALRVGWCELDHGTGHWGAASFDSYAADDTAHSLARIRAAVLGL